MTIYLALAVCLVGLFIFLMGPEPSPPNRKYKIGFAMFWVGLLAFLLQDSQLLSLLGKSVR
jgi:hypothetical protein